jgi:SAM-dependent methyltransferase
MKNQLAKGKMSFNIYRTAEEGVRMHPLSVVTRLPALCAPGAHVLDIGCGSGRNAAYLAQRGFQVDALDKSVRAVASLTCYAKAHGLPLNVTVFDIRSGELDFQSYSAIVCTLVLHHLTRDAAIALLTRARMQATIGALHAIGAVTLAGDFYQENGDEDRFYPEPGELSQSYSNSGWEIHHFGEEMRQMQQTHPDGQHMANLVSFVIARKVRS